MNHLKLFFALSILTAYVLALPSVQRSNGLRKGQISYSHFGDAAACQFNIPDYEKGMYVGVNNGVNLCGKMVRFFDDNGNPHDAKVIDATSSGDDTKMIGSAALFQALGKSERIGTLYDVKFGLCGRDISCPAIQDDSA